MIPNLTASVVVDGDVTTLSSWGLAWQDEAGNGFVQNLDFATTAYTFLTPCCHFLLGPRHSDVSCSCHARFSSDSYIEVTEPFNFALESYGCEVGWWTDPLEAVLHASVLLDTLGPVVQEAIKRQSIYQQAMAAKASVILAGLELVRKSSATPFAVSPGLREYRGFLPPRG